MRNAKELLFLAGDYWRYLVGSDYFRKSQGLGAYFTDSRCYYNDLRHKTAWKGRWVDGVPALHMVNTGEDLVMPITVLLYGIASIDRYFLESDRTQLDAIRRVSEWSIRAIRPEGYFDNGFSKRDPDHEYYSDNSGMCQGLALSFAIRAIQYELVEHDLRSRLRELVEKVMANVLLPFQQQGTALYQGDDLFFLEDSEKRGDIVLNGWIFAVFGLFDYLRLGKNEHVARCLETTLDTMKRWLPKYQLPNGWSYYDTLGRISSPFYHELHISLLDAMHRLTGASEFGACRDVFVKANGRINKVWYTLNKIKDRLRDNKALAR